MRQTNLRVLKLTFTGATAFWLPDVLWHWHAARRGDWRLWDILGASVLMCLTLLAAYLFFKKRHPGCAVGAPMMLGVWCFGGFFIMVAWSFEHAFFGSARWLSGRPEIIAAGGIPFFTYIVSAYDASLGALLLVNLVAIVIVLFQYRLAARRRKVSE